MRRKGNARKKKIVRWMIVFTGGVLLIAALLGFLYLRGTFLPRWTSFAEKTLTTDADHNGAEETIVLSGRRLRIYETSDAGWQVMDENDVEIAAQEKIMRWESDSTWLVSDVFVGDLNRDGLDEVIFLVWKRGSYGTVKPFWVEQDETGFSQHIFIYQFYNGKVHPIWMSSKIGIKIASMTMDRQHRIHLTAPDGSETVWAWETWGLTLQE